MFTVAYKMSESSNEEEQIVNPNYKAKGRRTMNRARTHRPTFEKRPVIEEGTTHNLDEQGLNRSFLDSSMEIQNYPSKKQKVKFPKSSLKKPKSQKKLNQEKVENTKQRRTSMRLKRQNLQQDIFEKSIDIDVKDVSEEDGQQKVSFKIPNKQKKGISFKNVSKTPKKKKKKSQSKKLTR